MSPDIGKQPGQYLITHSWRLPVFGRNCLIAVTALAFVAIAASGASAQSVDNSPIVGPKVVPGLSEPVRDLPPAPPPSPDPDEVNPLQGSGEPPDFLGPKGFVDPAAQFEDADSLDADSFALNLLGDPIVNVPGMGGSNPNDTNGDIGPNDFVQMINSRFRIFDRQGNPRGAAANINTLWTSVNPAGRQVRAVRAAEVSVGPGTCRRGL